MGAPTADPARPRRFSCWSTHWFYFGAKVRYFCPVLGLCILCLWSNSMALWLRLGWFQVQILSMPRIFQLGELILLYWRLRYVCWTPEILTIKIIPHLAGRPCSSLLKKFFQNLADFKLSKDSVEKSPYLYNKIKMFLNRTFLFWPIFKNRLRFPLILYYLEVQSTMEKFSCIINDCFWCCFSFERHTFLRLFSLNKS